MYNENWRNILLYVIKVNLGIIIPYFSKYCRGIFLVSCLKIDNYFQLFRKKSLRILHLQAFLHQHGIARVADLLISRNNIKARNYIPRIYLRAPSFFIFPDNTTFSVAKHTRILYRSERTQISEIARRTDPREQREKEKRDREEKEWGREDG